MVFNEWRKLCFRGMASASAGTHISEVGCKVNVGVWLSVSIVTWMPRNLRAFSHELNAFFSSSNCIGEMMHTIVCDLFNDQDSTYLLSDRCG